MTGLGAAVYSSVRYRTNDRNDYYGHFHSDSRSWQGGWVYQKVADILAGHGHIVVPITLSGLGDTPAPSANLETHVSEVVDVVKSHSDDLILVGQSYGGMIVSGVADAVPSRIHSLVYVDAYVPETGDSVWSLTTPRFRDMFIAGAKGDGLNCAAPANLDPRCRPQPGIRDRMPGAQAGHPGLRHRWQSPRR